MKSVEDIYPLSPMQQGMFFHALYAPHSGAYVEQITCVFEGELDLRSFQDAWRAVLNRHPILRTAFLWEGLDELLQVVRSEVDIVCERQDWRDAAPPAQKDRLAAFLEQDRIRGFELSQAPLTRCLLARTGEQTHEFVWTFHHLILDGWSISLILQDFFSSYDSIRRGKEVGPSASRPFRDYIEWLKRQEPQEAMNFWRREMGDFSAPTLLGVDRASREFLDQSEAVYEEERFHFSAETTNRLLAFSKRRQITMNTLLQGAWALLLSRYSGQSDVVLGATVSGRSPQLAGVNEMVGMFVNTLPIRARIEQSRPVIDWLKDFQAQLLATRQYEHSSLVQVHSCTNTPRGSQLFHSIVSFQNHPISEAFQSMDIGLKVHSLVVHHTRTTYPLTIIAEPDVPLSLVIVYDARCFNRPVIARIAEHLETLLANIEAAPETRISQLTVISPAERRSLLHDFNPPWERPMESPLCLHQLFERQVAADPGRTAVIAGSLRISYGELNARANQLAHHLIGLGVGPESRVGLCLERSIEMIVGVLGVLKAGGAYVPMDPKHPRERLAHIIGDAKVALTLTSRAMQNTLETTEARVELLDEDWASIGERPVEDPDSGVGPDHLMYVIYTSGSTGRPKGSLITHRNASRLFEAAGERFAFDESDVWTLFHSYAFDFSVWELWGALIYGGRLVVVSDQVSQSPEELYGLLHKEGVTVLNLTPSVFLQFLPIAVKATALALKLRYLIFGGEALDLSSLKPWFQRFGFDAPRLINMYGITETTVHVTFRAVTADDYPLQTTSPIGVPLADLQAYVLDAALQPVPMNVPGELYIGGAGLARGYLNLPGLTAERFLPNPFSTKLGERLYRTGDRVRTLGSREIEYLGRIDDQLKIRGFRIEPGEIEAAMRRCEHVREAIVVASEESPGDKRLVAYLTVDRDAALTASELRAFLGGRLPGYLIPSYFVFMEKLPLVANGKIDKRALPPVSAARQAIDQDYVAPRNDLEEDLTKMWREVLGLERIGMYDDFFELGGHSLLAARLVSRIREEFEVDLPLRSLFEATTIDRLAVAILHEQTGQIYPNALSEALAEIELLAESALKS